MGLCIAGGRFVVNFTALVTKSRGKPRAALHYTDQMVSSSTHTHKHIDLCEVLLGQYLAAATRWEYSMHKSIHAQWSNRVKPNKCKTNGQTADEHRPKNIYNFLPSGASSNVMCCYFLFFLGDVSIKLCHWKEVVHLYSVLTKNKSLFCVQWRCGRECRQNIHLARSSLWEAKTKLHIYLFVCYTK